MELVSWQATRRLAIELVKKTIAKIKIEITLLKSSVMMILHLLRLASISSPDVWYAPHLRVNGVTPPDLFPLLTTPETSWPALANRTHTFKLFLDMLYESGAHGLPPGAGTTDGELASLIATLKRRDIRVGLEIGGARWQRDRCDEAAALDFAATEQTHVSRWLRLGARSIPRRRTTR